MRLYLVRHGETILNQNHCYYGTTDVPLSERGVRQAEFLGERIGHVHYDRVISSPLARARSTAEYILQDSSAVIETDPRLAEQNFGIFEGLTYDEIRCRHPEELECWNSSFRDYRIPGGESFADVRERIDDFLSGLTPSDETVLLVAHKGTFGHMLASLLHLPADGFWNFVIDQGCYSCVDLEDGYAILRKLNASDPVEE